MLLTMLTIAGMLLFSSIVVDVGFVMLLRRQDQAAVDAAALAGVGTMLNEGKLVTTVREVLNLNLPEANFDAADLDTCPAEPLPAGWSRYPTANCLAHNQYWSELRVRVPIQDAPTVFAGLAGITSFEHTAFAQAKYRTAVDIFPFIVADGAEGNQCLKAGSSIPPSYGCGGNVQGSFGDVEFTQFGHIPSGTVRDCNGSTAQLMANVAGGLDHQLSVYIPAVTPEAVDDNICGYGDNHSVRPNAASPGTGNQPNAMGQALFGNLAVNDGGPSRLRRTSSLGSFNPTVSMAGGQVDDTPLWAFIDPNLNWSDDVPISCYIENFEGDVGGLNLDEDLWMTGVPNTVRDHLFTRFGYLDAGAGDRTTALMERCFAHYRGAQWDDGGLFLGPDSDFGQGCSGPCDDPIFTVDTVKEGSDIYDIQDSPRFGYVPMMLSTESLGDDPVHFQRFRAVYLQRILDCSAVSCPVVFDPGVGFPGSSKKSADALTAFIIPDAALPEGLGGEDGISEIGANRFAVLTR